jgi:hypothetical protein
VRQQALAVPRQTYVRALTEPVVDFLRRELAKPGTEPLRIVSSR